MAMLSQSLPNRRDRVLSRREIEAQIAEGRHIIIVEGKVLKCDAWLKFHPGGQKAIKHMVGRDATDEVTVLHSPEARKRMESYQIGRIEGRWANFLPPIQGGKFRRLAQMEELVPNTPEEEDEAAQDSSSSSMSSCSLPGSDAAEYRTPSFRRRKADSSSVSRASSQTSISSDEIVPSSKTPKMGHFDAVTKKEIELDIAKYPSLEPELQADIVRRYRLLHDRIKDEGLYNCNYWAYGVEGIRWSILVGLMLFFLHHGWYGLSGFFLGVFWHQMVFTVHDAGHMGITHDFQTDTVIGIIGAAFIGGLSLGWWKASHNVHHIVTNSPEHDPDIQHMPFFAVSHRFFDSLTSTYYDRLMSFDAFAKVLVQAQHYLYYPILCFGRFNLYVLSWTYLIMGQGPRKGPAAWHRWLEIAGNVFFWIWFGYGILYLTIPNWSGRIAFIMVSHVVTMPLHLQITLSHFAMSTSDMGTTESFPQKMLRTTMDVDCPQWLDFFHGGLQFQAVHHLYPRIPRHNLRRAQKLVMQFCQETAIPYALYGFVEGNKDVISKLGDVARQARILKRCKDTIAASEDYGMH